ncbi:MAG TPA: helix-turn-helix domain-containing protein [Saprospiraceae bacterium]|nr:helix-turn-helix domain-containing protein [Saprospiraceae bacterium]
MAENIRYLRKKFHVSQQELADAVSVARNTIGDYERGKTEPTIQGLIRIADYFKISVDELLKVKISHQDYEIIRSKDLRVLAISVDKNNEDHIDLVETKAEAGYLDSYSDPEYIKDLPKISFPNIPAGSTLRAFEIHGDSMLPIESGSIVIASYVENLSGLKDQKTYIVISRQEGVVYKRIQQLKDQNQLLLISDNELYKPYTIHYREIAELWQYYAHLSFSDSKAAFNSLLEDKLAEIKYELKIIRDQLQTD